jgi:hypothetical protein
MILKPIDDDSLIDSYEWKDIEQYPLQFSVNYTVNHLVKLFLRIFIALHLLLYKFHHIASQG